MFWSLTDFKDGSRRETVDTYKEFLGIKGDMEQISNDFSFIEQCNLLVFFLTKPFNLCAVAIVEQPNTTDRIVVEDDERNGSNVTPPVNRPSHARRPRVHGNGM